jgi:hypothetical protein
MKNHPFIVATTAATVGVLLGGFIVVQLLGTPPKLDDSGNSARAAVEAKAPPSIAPPHIAETTGSSSAETVASKDCDQQTWPNLTRNCIKNGGAVASTATTQTTDRAAPDTKPAAPPIAAVPAAPPPIASVPVNAADAAPASHAATQPASVTATPVADPKPEAAVAVQAAPEQTADKADAKAKHVAKKSKRKAKEPSKKPTKELDDEGNSAFADNASDDRADRRSRRSPRIVERWTERDYDVPDDDGYGRRNVVIRRGHDRPFGGLFGGFGGDD